MRFTWINKQGVTCDEGFTVQRADRFTYEYREADREMRLKGESILGDLRGAFFGFGFYPSWRNERWQPPHETLPLTMADRERIVQNVTAAIAFMGGRAEFN